MSPKQKKILGMLVGGGPAPGINGVIRSVTIEAINSGLDVVGIYDGYKGLLAGRTRDVVKLQIDDVSRIHHTGGSILRTSRANPTGNKKQLQNVLRTLTKLKINYLITIGGDDTAFSAHCLAELTKGSIKIVHVPKTIDNDLPLPGLMPTFGFHTARHVGTELVAALMEDAKTTSRWYFVVTMGRKAGHLALGIGKAAGATLTIIGEEFAGPKIGFSQICDILEGAMIKRLAMGRGDGVAVLAEGLLDRIDVIELEKQVALVRDPHGHVRFEEIDLGGILKREVQKRFAKRGHKIAIVSKRIGYELRSQPPIPFDKEYTQDLGYAAVRYLLNGGSGAIVSIKRGGKIDPLPFADLIDIKTGRMNIRLVDVASDSYQVARSYMIRLEKKDFADKVWLKKLAHTAGMSGADFRKKFGKSL